jgi:DNA topoisomerase-1
MKTLVIVESPAKAKTIAKFLGKDYIVKSSFGHVRDLPKSKLGVDVENNFKPTYTINKDKAKVSQELREAAKKVKHILFATDADREGEAISWHLAEILKVKTKDVQRIVFHEITKHAIEEAIAHPRPLDMKLVDAQQARRILDRLVGYEMSPFLWKKIARGLSAGRVQSVAVRFVVEREREINAFKPEEFWSLEGIFEDKDKQQIIAKLNAIAGKKLDKMDLKNKKQVDKILKDLTKRKYEVAEVDKKETTRTPNAPFTTSTLQQEANHRLGFSAKQTMRLAQQLYEGVEMNGEGSVGLITYMRTDSLNLSEKFLTEAATVINQKFGKDYSIKTPRIFKTKSKNSQEAHEAIRPTEADRTPEGLKNSLTTSQFRLYDLIWRRAMASQMANAKIEKTGIDIKSDNDYNFRATGQVITFEGFLKLFPEKSIDNILPITTKGEPLTEKELKPEQHFTEPPARYSDATLVKALEEFEIGRPSTYAPTIATIEARNYTERDEHKRLKPTEIAFIVNDMLVKHFPEIVDFKFTAEMEDDLDQISLGKKEWQPIIANFYFPFKKLLTKKDMELTKKELTEEKTDEVCDKCGKPMSIKVGRFGKFMACTGYPDCRNTQKMDGEAGPATPEAPLEMTTEKCEKCGELMARRTGKFGPFLSCSAYPKCKNIKSIEVPTGVKCPDCGGDIIERHSRNGKLFFGCNSYPKCKFALWNRPNGEKCPKCQSLMTTKPNGEIVCGNKDCT